MQEDRAIAASGTGALVSDQAPSGLAPTGFDPAIAHCKASDLLSIGEGTPADILEALDSYFATFARPLRKDGKTCCINCGEALDGMLHALGAGQAAVWGLAHGEAYCSGCKWPMRGMHYVKDANGSEIISARNLFLSYHPDQVTKAEAKS